MANSNWGKAIGHALMAFGHLAFGQRQEDETPETPKRRRRIKRQSGGDDSEVGTKPCCTSRRKVSLRSEAGED